MPLCKTQATGVEPMFRSRHRDEGVVVQLEALNSFEAREIWELGEA